MKFLINETFALSLTLFLFRYKAHGSALNKGSKPTSDGTVRKTIAVIEPESRFGIKLAKIADPSPTRVAVIKTDRGYLKSLLVIRCRTTGMTSTTNTLEAAWVKNNSTANSPERNIAESNPAIAIPIAKKPTCFCWLLVAKLLSANTPTN